MRGWEGFYLNSFNRNQLKIVLKAETTQQTLSSSNQDVRIQRNLSSNVTIFSNSCYYI